MRSALVLEDHSETRRCLVSLLAEAFPAAEIVDAPTLQQARALMAERDIDFALIDINLPDGNGIDLVWELTETSPETYSVMATIYDDDTHLFPALQAGARGYLLKGQPREKLIAQIRGILEGEPPLSPSIADRVIQHFRRERPLSEDMQLTGRECDVLSLTAKGLRRTEVAQELDIAPNTVAGHLKKIYRKLNVSSRAEAVLEAANRGLVEPK